MTTIDATTIMVISEPIPIGIFVGKDGQAYTVNHWSRNESLETQIALRSAALHAIRRYVSGEANGLFLEECFQLVPLVPKAGAR